MAAKAITNIVVNQHTSGPLNGTIALFIGLYLMAVVFMGNGPAFRQALDQDIFGPSPTGHGTYIGWFFAFLILYTLARNDATRSWGTAFFVLALVAMLINLQTTASGFLGNIVSFVEGQGSTGGTSGAGATTTTG